MTVMLNPAFLWKKRPKLLKKKRNRFSGREENKTETLRPTGTKQPLAEFSSDSDEDGKLIGKKEFLYSDNGNLTSNKTKNKKSYNYKQPSIDSMFQNFIKGKLGAIHKDSEVEVESFNEQKRGSKNDISQSKVETVLDQQTEDYVSEETNNNVKLSTDESELSCHQRIAEKKPNSEKKKRKSEDKKGDKTVKGKKLVCDDSDSDNLTGGNSLQLSHSSNSEPESSCHQNIKKRKAEIEPNEEKKKKKVSEEIGVKKVMEKRLTKVSDEWFYQTNKLDSNGHKMSSYLRRVPHDDYKVECSVCHCRVLVKFKGKCAINDHIKGVKHQTNMKNLNINTIGTYMEKNTSNSVEDAEVGIVRFVAVHGISFAVVPHLVKLLKEIFKDSKTCQAMGGLSRSRVRYGLIGGLGKTELDQTVEDMNKTPFSIQLDGGLKGGRHREQFLTRYFDQEQEQVVDKFILAKTLNNENATLIANTFLDWSNENKVPVGEKMIMMNSDHASTLRGSQSGAIIRISRKAPNIKTCDIGGDVLHDLNNSCKDSFYKVLPRVVKLLDITSQEFNKSAKKTETFSDICGKHGLSTIKPAKWCRSRFLSRVDCIKERRKRLSAYEEYYENAEAPKRKKQKLTGRNSFQLNSVNSEESSLESEDETRQEKGKKMEWLKKKLSDELDSTTVLLDLALECLKSSDSLLRVFQTQKPAIHILKASLLEYTKECFLQITASRNLLNSDGSNIGGTGLKKLKFETSQERLERKDKDKELEKEINILEVHLAGLEDDLKLSDVTSEKKDLTKRIEQTKKQREKLQLKVSSGRYVKLLDIKDMTLTKEVKVTISDLTKNLEEGKVRSAELVLMAKEKKRDFYHSLALNIQKRLPLDNQILTNLAYIDPALINNEKTEAAFRKIAEKMPCFIKPEEKDDVIAELRNLQIRKEDFGEDFKEYVLQKKDENLPFQELMRIDQVWSKIISNKKKYPNLGRFIMATLSFIHSTTGAEGSVRDIRHILGDVRHKYTDEACTARLAVLSAVRSCKKSSCCFDYTQNQMVGRINWRNSWKTQESRKHEEEAEISGEHDSSSGSSESDD